MKYWVDPPEGWRYGFPKVWDKEAHPDWEAWLKQAGYPADQIAELPYVRMWQADAAEPKTG